MSYVMGETLHHTFDYEIRYVLLTLTCNTWLVPSTVVQCSAVCTIAKSFCVCLFIYLYSQSVCLSHSIQVLEREAAMQVQQKIMMAGLKLSLSKVTTTTTHMYHQLFLLQSQAQNTDLREALAKIRSIATISDSVLLPEISLSMSRSQVSCLYCSGYFRIFEILCLF